MSVIDLIQFKYDFVENDDAVSLKYECVNGSDYPIFIASSLPPIDYPFGQEDAKRLYCFWHTAYVLHFTKRQWPVYAKDMDKMRLAIKTFFKKMNPGQTIRESFTLPNPFALSHPYCDDFGFSADEKIKLSRFATFSLGFVDESPDCPLTPVYREDMEAVERMMKEDAPADEINKVIQNSEKPSESKTPYEEFYHGSILNLMEKQQYLRDDPQPINMIAVDPLYKEIEKI